LLHLIIVNEKTILRTAYFFSASSFAPNPCVPLSVFLQRCWWNYARWHIHHVKTAIGYCHRYRAVYLFILRMIWCN